MCIAFGPGAAKDTLPTRTFWQTVRDYGRLTVLTGRDGATRGFTYNAAEDVAFDGLFMPHAQIGKDGSLVLGYCCVMKLFNLGKFIRVYEVEGRGPDQLMWFISW